MPTKQKDKLNPSERQWDETLENRPTLNEDIAPKDKAASQARNRLRRSEANATEETSAESNIAQQEEQPNLYSGSDVSRANVRAPMNPALKRWIYISVPSAIISLAFALGAFVSGAFVSIKEMALSHFTRNHYSVYSRRTPKLQKRAFTEPDEGCKGIRCRGKNGVSDKEIKKYEKAGWEMDIEETAEGKKWIKSAHVPGENGEKVLLNLENFEENYAKDAKIRGGAWVISKPKALIYRAKAAIKKYTQFHVLRNKLFKKASEVRRYLFGGSKKSNGNIDDPPDEEDDLDENQKKNLDDSANKLGDIEDDIKDAASKEVSDLEACNYECSPKVRPDMNNLDVDPAKAEGAAKGLAEGGIKGAALGVLNAIDKACTGYQIVRTLSIGAKVFKYAAFIMFAMSFMTHADASKAGQIPWEAISLMAGWLVRPSTDPDSLGKTAANSNLFSLITEGKVQNRAGLGFGVMGTAALTFLQTAKKLFERLGANATNCRQVRSWYGQAGIALAGIATTLLSGGTLSWLGIASGVLIGATISVLAQYVTPFLIQFIAGTVAPDPSDSGGGFRAGEAIASGLGAMGSELGKAGLRPIPISEASTIEKETNEEIAKINEVERMGKSPFDVTVPDSIANRLALAIMPFVVAPATPASFQNMAALTTSPFSLIGSSINQLFFQKAGAQSAAYGGAYCADEEMLKMQIVTDAYCNPVYGEKAEVIDDQKYSPAISRDYMIDKGHVTEADGSPQSDEYKKFRDSCIDGDAPLTADGAPIDVTDTGTDTTLCRMAEENDTYTLVQDYRARNADGTPGDILKANDGTLLTKGATIHASRETMYRSFVMDTNIDDGMDASANGTLGAQQGDEGATQPTGPLNPGAFAWPLIPVGVISSCMNATDPSYRLHNGLDIAAPIGTNIVAVADGEVVFEGKGVQGYGYYIAVRHANGSITGYGHNQENLVAQGDQVKQGQVIAKVGSRGESTGPHLHLNYIPSGNSVFSTSANAANPLFGNLLAVPAGIGDENGCLKPPKLKAR